MHEAYFARLPTEIVVLVHSCVLQADPTLRSCLALEATCKHLRSLLYSNTRFGKVHVQSRNLATAQGDSFWSWIAAHGRRTDCLQLHNLGLRHSTPQLCSQAGVLQAEAVAVSAAVVDTLEPLRGLLNLASLENRSPPTDAQGDVSMEPLAGLPALEHVELREVASNATSLAPLGSMAALTCLHLRNYDIPQVDALRGLSQLRSISLAGFYHAACLAPLSCLTCLTSVMLMGFPLLDNVTPLHALSSLVQLTMCFRSRGSISLEPLRYLPSLSVLMLKGDGPGCMTDYDLQPLSALARTLRLLILNLCVLRNVPSLGSLGTMLRSLTLVDCDCQPGFQLASLLTQLPLLVLLSISDVTAADLDCIGQRLRLLQELGLKRAADVTSLAALAPLTHLRSITLDSCSHISSIHPLTALTRLETVHLLSCPQLASLHPLTALPSLRQLRVEGCPLLDASPPTGLQPLLVAAGQDA
jgi:hypothetical protein